MAFRVDGDGFYITKKRVIYNDDPPTVCDGLLVYGHVRTTGVWPFKRKVLKCVSIPTFPPPYNEPLACYVLRNFIGRPGMTYDMRGKLISRLSYFRPEDLERKAEPHEYDPIVAMIALDDAMRDYLYLLPWHGRN